MGARAALKRFDSTKVVGIILVAIFYSTSTVIKIPML